MGKFSISWEAAELPCGMEVFRVCGVAGRKPADVGETWIRMGQAVLGMTGRKFLEKEFALIQQADSKGVPCKHTVGVGWFINHANWPTLIKE